MCGFGCYNKHRPLNYRAFIKTICKELNTPLWEINQRRGAAAKTSYFYHPEDDYFPTEARFDAFSI